MMILFCLFYTIKSARMGVNVLKPVTQTSILNKPINIKQSVTHLFHIIAAVCCSGEQVHFWSVLHFSSMECQQNWLQGKTWGGT